jgi:hypothetical protein
MDISVHLHHSQGQEPRENRGRLRHCNGRKLPLATVPLTERRGKAGARLRPKSGYRSGCARRGPAKRDQLLRQEKDEASLFHECETGFLNAFILRFAGDEGFLCADLSRLYP